MKRFFVISCAFVLLLSGCKRNSSEQEYAIEKAEYSQTLQSRANKAVNSIQYVRDNRTNLCFAYYWGEGGRDTPSLTLATLSCADISSNLSNNQDANEVLDSVNYLKDGRTNSCFAYYWSNDLNSGGPSLTLATVPCESIPANILVTANK